MNNLVALPLMHIVFELNTERNCSCAVLDITTDTRSLKLVRLLCLFPFSDFLTHKACVHEHNS